MRRLIALLCLVIGMHYLFLTPLHAVTPADDAAGSLYLPLITRTSPKACTANLTPTRFGLQMYDTTGKADRFYPYLVDSGAHWVRVEIAWASIEPTNVDPKQYNWAKADAAVAAATDGCFNIMLTIGSAPAWALSSLGGPDGPLDETKLGDFAEFLGALAERYDGDGINDADGSPLVNYFELYNEPDGNDTPLVGRWGRYGARYAQMLATASPAIKSANPNAQIVFGGIAYDAFEDQGGQFVRSFLDDVLAAGGADYFDIMSFHQYPAFRKRWTTGNGPGLLEKAIDVRQKLTNHGVNKPIMITESGWHSSNDDPNYPSSEENQSRYVVQLFVQSMAANIDMLVWWSLYDLPDYPFADGLVASGDPVFQKPSYGVYRILVDELTSAQYVRTLSSSETKNVDMEAYQFTDSSLGQTMYVAWLDPVDSTKTSSLRLVGSAATVRNLHGTTTTLLDKDDGKIDDHVIVSITGQPVYIRITQP